MENFKNMDPNWVDVPFDPGRHYSVPWQWGTDRRDRQHQGLSRATPTPRRIFFDPPDELKGKINVVPEMNDVMYRGHHAMSAASPAPTTRRC